MPGPKPNCVDSFDESYCPNDAIRTDDATKECADYTCAPTDAGECCLAAPCSTYESAVGQCPGDSVLDQSASCAGDLCTSADEVTCCRSSCSFYESHVAECEGGDTKLVRTEQKCMSTTCDAGDVGNCCALRTTCASESGSNMCSNAGKVLDAAARARLCADSQCIAEDDEDTCCGTTPSLEISGDSNENFYDETFTLCHNVPVTLTMWNRGTIYEREVSSCDIMNSASSYDLGEQSYKKEESCTLKPSVEQCYAFANYNSYKVGTGYAENNLGKSGMDRILWENSWFKNYIGDPALESGCFYIEDLSLPYGGGTHSNVVIYIKDSDLGTDSGDSNQNFGSSENHGYYHGNTIDNVCARIKLVHTEANGGRLHFFDSQFGASQDQTRYFTLYEDCNYKSFQTTCSSPPGECGDIADKDKFCDAGYGYDDSKDTANCQGPTCGTPQDRTVTCCKEIATCAEGAVDGMYTTVPQWCFSNHNMKAKAEPQNIWCASTSCTSDECCLPARTCTSAYDDDGLRCPEGFVLDQEAFCAGEATCTQEADFGDSSTSCCKVAQKCKDWSDSMMTNMDGSLMTPAELCPGWNADDPPYATLEYNAATHDNVYCKGGMHENYCDHYVCCRVPPPPAKCSSIEADAETFCSSIWGTYKSEAADTLCDSDPCDPSVDLNTCCNAGTEPPKCSDGFDGGFTVDDFCAYEDGYSASNPESTGAYCIESDHTSGKCKFDSEENRKRCCKQTCNVFDPYESDSLPCPISDGKIFYRYEVHVNNLVCSGFPCTVDDGQVCCTRTAPTCQDFYDSGGFDHYCTNKYFINATAYYDSNVNQDHEHHKFQVCCGDTAPKPTCAEAHSDDICVLSEGVRINKNADQECAEYTCSQNECCGIRQWCHSGVDTPEKEAALCGDMGNGIQGVKDDTKFGLFCATEVCGEDANDQVKCCKEAPKCKDYFTDAVCQSNSNYVTSAQPTQGQGGAHSSQFSANSSNAEAYCSGGDCETNKDVNVNLCCEFEPYYCNNPFSGFTDAHCKSRMIYAGATEDASTTLCPDGICGGTLQIYDLCCQRLTCGDVYKYPQDCQAQAGSSGIWAPILSMQDEECGNVPGGSSGCLHQTNMETCCYNTLEHTCASYYPTRIECANAGFDGEPDYLQSNDGSRKCLFDDCELEESKEHCCQSVRSTVTCSDAQQIKSLCDVDDYFTNANPDHVCAEGHTCTESECCVKRQQCGDANETQVCGYGFMLDPVRSASYCATNACDLGDQDVCCKLAPTCSDAFNDYQCQLIGPSLHAEAIGVVSATAAPDQFELSAANADAVCSDNQCDLTDSAEIAVCCSFKKQVCTDMFSDAACKTFETLKFKRLKHNASQIECIGGICQSIKEQFDNCCEPNTCGDLYDKYETPCKTLKGESWAVVQSRLDDICDSGGDASCYGTNNAEYCCYDKNVHSCANYFQGAKECELAGHATVPEYLTSDPARSCSYGDCTSETAIKSCCLGEMPKCSEAHDRGLCSADSLYEINADNVCADSECTEQECCGTRQACSVAFATTEGEELLCGAGYRKAEANATKFCATDQCGLTFEDRDLCCERIYTCVEEFTNEQCKIFGPLHHSEAVPLDEQRFADPDQFALDLTNLNSICSGECNFDEADDVSLCCSYTKHYCDSAFSDSICATENGANLGKFSGLKLDASSILCLNGNCDTSHLASYENCCVKKTCADVYPTATECNQFGTTSLLPRDSNLQAECSMVFSAAEGGVENCLSPKTAEDFCCFDQEDHSCATYFPSEAECTAADVTYGGGTPDYQSNDPDRKCLYGDCTSEASAKACCSGEKPLCSLAHANNICSISELLFEKSATYACHDFTCTVDQCCGNREICLHGTKTDDDEPYVCGEDGFYRKDPEKYSNLCVNDRCNHADKNTCCRKIGTCSDATTDAVCKSVGPSYYEVPTHRWNSDDGQSHALSSQFSVDTTSADLKCAGSQYATQNIFTCTLNNEYDVTRCCAFEGQYCDSTFTDEVCTSSNVGSYVGMKADASSILCLDGMCTKGSVGDIYEPNYDVCCQPKICADTYTDDLTCNTYADLSGASNGTWKIRLSNQLLACYDKDNENMGRDCEAFGNAEYCCFDSDVHTCPNHFTGQLECANAGYDQVPEYLSSDLERECLYGDCSHADAIAACCAGEKPTCKASQEQVPGLCSSQGLENKDSNTVCAGFECTISDCCQTPTCNVAIARSNITTLRYGLCATADLVGNRTYRCADYECTEDECCVKPTCNQSGVCDANHLYMLDASMQCDDHTCTQDECCAKPTCGQSGLCDADHLHMLDASMQCDDYTCTQDECCAERETCGSALDSQFEIDQLCGSDENYILQESNRYALCTTNNCGDDYADIDLCCRKAVACDEIFSDGVCQTNGPAVHPAARPQNGQSNADSSQFQLNTDNAKKLCSGSECNVDQADDVGQCCSFTEHYCNDPVTGFSPPLCQSKEKYGSVKEGYESILCLDGICDKNHNASLEHCCRPLTCGEAYGDNYVCQDKADELSMGTDWIFKWERFTQPCNDDGLLSGEGENLPDCSGSANLAFCCLSQPLQECGEYFPTGKACQRWGFDVNTPYQMGRDFHRKCVNGDCNSKAAAEQCCLPPDQWTDAVTCESVRDTADEFCKLTADGRARYGNFNEANANYYCVGSPACDKGLDQERCCTEGNKCDAGFAGFDSVAAFCGDGENGLSKERDYLNSRYCFPDANNPSKCRVADINKETCCLQHCKVGFENNRDWCRLSDELYFDENKINYPYGEYCNNYPCQDEHPDDYRCCENAPSCDDWYNDAANDNVCPNRERNMYGKYYNPLLSNGQEGSAQKVCCGQLKDAPYCRDSHDNGDFCNLNSDPHAVNINRNTQCKTHTCTQEECCGQKQQCKDAFDVEGAEDAVCGSDMMWDATKGENYCGGHVCNHLDTLTCCKDSERCGDFFTDASVYCQNWGIQYFTDAFTPVNGIVAPAISSQFEPDPTKQYEYCSNPGCGEDDVSTCCKGIPLTCNNPETGFTDELCTDPSKLGRFKGLKPNAATTMCLGGICDHNHFTNSPDDFDSYDQCCEPADEQGAYPICSVWHQRVCDLSVEHAIFKNGNQRCNDYECTSDECCGFKETCGEAMQKEGGEALVCADRLPNAYMQDQLKYDNYCAGEFCTNEDKDTCCVQAMTCVNFFDNNKCRELGPNYHDKALSTFHGLEARARSGQFIADLAREYDYCTFPFCNEEDVNTCCKFVPDTCANGFSHAQCTKRFGGLLLEPGDVYKGLKDNAANIQCLDGICDTNDWRTTKMTDFDSFANCCEPSKNYCVHAHRDNICDYLANSANVNPEKRCYSPRPDTGWLYGEFRPLSLPDELVQGSDDPELCCYIVHPQRKQYYKLRHAPGEFAGATKNYWLKTYVGGMDYMGELSNTQGTCTTDQCCALRMQCQDADAGDICGDGAYVNPSAADSLCATNVCGAADRDLCCIEKMKCEEADEANTCGNNFVFNPSAASSYCATEQCGAADQNVCCVEKMKCEEADEANTCGDGFVLNPSAASSYCATNLCGAADKDVCCAEIMKCEDANEENTCGDGFALNPLEASSLCATHECGPADKDVCCEVRCDGEYKWVRPEPQLSDPVENQNGYDFGPYSSGLIVSGMTTSSREEKAPVLRYGRKCYNQHSKTMMPEPLLKASVTFYEDLQQYASECSAYCRSHGYKHQLIANAGSGPDFDKYCACAAVDCPSELDSGIGSMVIERRCVPAKKSCWARATLDLPSGSHQSGMTIEEYNAKGKICTNFNSNDVIDLSASSDFFQIDLEASVSFQDDIEKWVSECSLVRKYKYANPLMGVTLNSAGQLLALASNPKRCFATSECLGSGVRDAEADEYQLVVNTCKESSLSDCWSRPRPNAVQGTVFLSDGTFAAANGRTCSAFEDGGGRGTTVSASFYENLQQWATECREYCDGQSGYAEGPILAQGTNPFQCTCDYSDICDNPYDTTPSETQGQHWEYQIIEPQACTQ